MIRRLAPWLALLAVVAAALVLGASEGAAPTAEERVEAIASEVRCPTCQGLSAAESSAPAARAVRTFVAEQVEEGRSDDEIKAALAARFGKDILLKPESGGVAGLVWALPVAGLIIGAAALGFAFRRWKRESEARPTSDPAPGGPARAEATPPQSRGRLAITAAAVVALSGLAGWGLSAAVGERLPGQEATGSIETAAAPVDRLTRAQQLVSEGEVLDAVKLYDEILSENPSGRTKAIALAQRGWLISRAAEADPTLADRGLAQIDEAIATDPDYADAYFFKGMLLARQKDDPVGAIVAYRKFLGLSPPPELKSFVEDELRTAIAVAQQRNLPIPAAETIPSAEPAHP